MNDFNNLFKIVKKELTSEGQMFEIRSITNGDNSYDEYVSFPENLKGYFDIAMLHADKEFIVYNSERFTFKDIYEKSAQFANALKDYGIKKGDRVSICMQNNPEYIIAYMGITGLGAICVPLNSWWVPDEIIYAVEHSESKILVGDLKRLQGLETLSDLKKIVTSYTPSDEFQSFKDFINNKSVTWPENDLNRDDHATIYYTSGSTGKPKGVLSSQRGIISTMFSWACYSSIVTECNKRLGKEEESLLNPELSILLCVPLFHATGSHAIFLMSILVGRKIIMMKKWDAGIALKLIHDEKITDITGVPTQTWELLNHPDRSKYDLSSLRTLGGGGGPRPAEHVKLLDNGFKARPGIGYGLTETNALGTLGNGDEYIANPTSAGRVVPPLTKIKILNQNGQKAEEGEIGEIIIKSQSNMIGYWKNDKATKNCLTDDGWLSTGDLGKFEGPHLFIVDRIKDIVIRGGENIACPEVENAIYKHPDVLEVCVFGIPDERLGELLCASIFLREESNLCQEDLKKFLSDKLAAFKIPIKIKFSSNNLPLLASGKFDKPSLRKEFLSS